MLALAGVGRVVMDVTATTLLQRATDSRMLARMFGALEGIHMASLAVGSIVAPLLIAVAGQRGAFVLAAIGHAAGRGLSLADHAAAG